MNRMPRLPIPGSDEGTWGDISDEGTWGDILNAYLQAAHNADGSLKNNTVSASKIQDATISEAKLDTALAAKVNSVAGDPTMGGDLRYCLKCSNCRCCRRYHRTSQQRRYYGQDNRCQCHHC